MIEKGLFTFLILSNLNGLVFGTVRLGGTNDLVLKLLISFSNCLFFFFASLMKSSKDLPLNFFDDFVSGFDVVIIAFNYKRREIDGDGSYIKYGMMSGMRLECGEPSFKSSKDGIWLYSNDLARQITDTLM